MLKGCTEITPPDDWEFLGTINSLEIYHDENHLNHKYFQWHVFNRKFEKEHKVEMLSFLKYKRTEWKFKGHLGAVQDQTE